MKIYAIPLLFLFIVINKHKLYGQEILSIMDSRDGNIYPVIKINTKLWFAEDLRFRHKNAITIEKAEDKADVYYPWQVLMNDSKKEKARGLCPEGWHVPSRDEWDALLFEFGGSCRGWAALRDSGRSKLNIKLTGTYTNGSVKRVNKSVNYWSSSSTLSPELPSWRKKQQSNGRYAFSFYFHNDDDFIYPGPEKIGEAYKCRCVREAN